MTRVKRIASALFGVMMLLSLQIPAAAADTTLDLSKPGSISITLKDRAEPYQVIPNAGFCLYQVGKAFSVDGQLCFGATEDFVASNISLDDLRADGLADHLAAYTQRQALAGTHAISGADGRISFQNLQTGLYLLVQDQSVSGYYNTAPFLISVPMTNSSGTGWLYDIFANPKAEARPGSSGSSGSSTSRKTLTVQKKWNGGSENTPPKITVALLRDGIIYDTQELSASNDWATTWKNLSTNYRWTVSEVDIPNGYQVDYSTSGSKTVITNTYLPVLPSQPTSLTVKKQWKTNGNAHPDFVTVELWNGNEPYAFAVLNDGNHWSATWTQLPASTAWHIYEVDIPTQYEATYSSEGTTLTILNTDTSAPILPDPANPTVPATPEDIDPSEPPLIQTGQLNWPIPLLATMGIFLFVVGWIIYRRGKKYDET